MSICLALSSAPRSTALNHWIGTPPKPRGGKRSVGGGGKGPFRKLEQSLVVDVDEDIGGEGGGLEEGKRATQCTNKLHIPLPPQKP